MWKRSFHSQEKGICCRKCINWPLFCPCSVLLSNRIHILEKYFSAIDFRFPIWKWDFFQLQGQIRVQQILAHPLISFPWKKSTHSSSYMLQQCISAWVIRTCLNLSCSWAQEFSNNSCTVGNAIRASFSDSKWNEWHNCPLLKKIKLMSVIVTCHQCRLQCGQWKIQLVEAGDIV